MQLYDDAMKKHQEFQAARQAALKEIDGEIERLQAKKREVLAWGKAAAPAPKKRGRPRKDEREVAHVAV